MSKNLEAFSTFRDQLKGQHQFFNGDESFLGHVIYYFKGQYLNETLKINLRLTTFEYGRISIEDGNILNTNIVHMEFNSDFQEYSLNNEGFLIIKGKSKRLGNYEVKINQV